MRDTGCIKIDRSTALRRGEPVAVGRTIGVFWARLASSLGSLGASIRGA